MPDSAPAPGSAPEPDVPRPPDPSAPAAASTAPAARAPSGPPLRSRAAERPRLRPLDILVMSFVIVIALTGMAALAGVVLIGIGLSSWGSNK